MKLAFFLLLIALASCSGDSSNGSNNAISRKQMGVSQYPVAFIANVPVVSLKASLNAFGNHGTSITDSIPGGGLFIIYPTGEIKDITAAAGFGIPSGELQAGDNAIAVRRPSVHFNGEKILFSMLIGGPKERFDRAAQRRWQIYEATQLALEQTPIIRKVEGQPADYNNLSPIYAPNGDVIYISDAPLYDMTHTYPQLDEYESMPTTTGIFRLNIQTKKNTMIEHAPSGVFDLSLDSFGRLLFTKWDHLKRDQQADADRYSGGTYRAYDFPNELPTATRTAFPVNNSEGKLQADARGVLYELFPEARDWKDPTRNPNENIQNFNQFFIWQVNPDGTEEETINHVGRHEFGGVYMPPSFRDDPNLSEFLPEDGVNRRMRDTFTGNAGLFQLTEDISRPGTYLATFAHEFGREAAGRIVEFTLPPTKNPEDVVMREYTNRNSNAGHFRNPVRLSDNTILVSHTAENRTNEDDSTDPQVIRPRYVFQLRRMENVAGRRSFTAGPTLTKGISRHILFWGDLPTPREYQGELTETNPVELRPRPIPKERQGQIASVEERILEEEGVEPARLKRYLKDRNLALIVSRNVTLRDKADLTQPSNLRIPEGTSALPFPGKIYDVKYLQIFQGELTRSYEKQNGRRVYARPIRNTLEHEDIERYYGEGQGRVKLGADGSMAAVVPAGRAISWQLTSPSGKAVVRERVWVSFAPGEIRTCASCHGINKESHQGFPEPTNPPQAFRELVRKLKTEL